MTWINKLIIWVYSLEIRYQVWKLGRVKLLDKELPDGSVVMKNKKGSMYFVAVDSTSIPVLVSKEEGERLWNYKQEAVWTVDKD